MAGLAVDGPVDRRVGKKLRGGPGRHTRRTALSRTAARMVSRQPFEWMHCICSACATFNDGVFRRVKAARRCLRAGWDRVLTVDENSNTQLLIAVDTSNDGHQLAVVGSETSLEQLKATCSSGQRGSDLQKGRDTLGGKHGKAPQQQASMRTIRGLQPFFAGQPSQPTFGVSITVH